MRDYKAELENRIQFVRDLLKKTGAKGIIFGNSGGKDSALVGIICKMACENTVGIIMPCASKQNYGSDTDDANAVAEKFGIENRTVDLTAAREEIIKSASKVSTLTPEAISNIAPRLRMATLYAIGQWEGRLVAGTGKRSEADMGYFTKWGDGAHDFNVIFDLTATEVFEFLRYLEAPLSIIEKAPSAGLYDGQTDEKDMGVTYAAIDKFITTGEANDEDRATIERYHKRSLHKLEPIVRYGGIDKP